MSIAAIAGIGASALAGTATASATFPGRDGRIAAVVTDRDDPARPTNVLTMSPDGKHRRVITHTRPGRDGGPTNVGFSPDGRWMVFDRRACPDACHYNVGVMRADGSHVRLLTRRRHGSDANFGFSPDGSQVGFTRDLGQIFVAGARSGHPQRLIRYGPGVAVTSLSFSPDGGSVLFGRFAAADSSSTICTVTIASREETCLGEGSSPRWAPNGRAILFTDSDGSGISRMRPDGSDRTRLISGSRMRVLAFSPDGRRFAYLRETAKGRKLYVAKPDGTHRRAITHDGQDYEASFDMAFSPDSKHLIYRSGWWRKGFYSSRIDGSHAKRIRVTPRLIEGPSGSLAWGPRT